MNNDKVPGVVVSGEQQPGRLGFRSIFSRSNLPFKLGLLAVVLLVAGGVVYFMFLHDNAERSTTKTDTSKPAEKSPFKAVEVKQEQLSDAELMNKVNYLMGTKQYADAEKLIQFQSDLDTSKTKLTLLASVLQADGRADEAAEVSAKLAKLDDLQPGEYAVIAQNYEAAGDKQKAVEYYQKAIDAYNKRKIGSYQSTVARLETKIKELQK